MSTLIDDSKKMSEKEFTEMLAELCDRYYNGSLDDFKDPKKRPISDSVYDQLRLIYAKRFGRSYAAVGAPVRKELKADKRKASDGWDSDSDSKKKVRHLLPSQKKKKPRAVAAKKRKLASKAKRGSSDGPVSECIRESLPNQMPSLAEAKTDDKLITWIKKLNWRGVVNHTPSPPPTDSQSFTTAASTIDSGRGARPPAFLLSRKIDGASSLADSKDMWGRGNGRIGAKTSHLLPLLRLPAIPDGYRVRAEIVMFREAFDLRYKGININPRNTCSGIINSKQPSKQEVEDLTFLAYQLIKIGEENTIPLAEQFEQLKNMGFQTPFICNLYFRDGHDPRLGEPLYCTGGTGGTDLLELEDEKGRPVTMNKEWLTALTASEREISKYDMDGIVIGQNISLPSPPLDLELAANREACKGRSAEEPKHLRAFKPEDAPVPTTVTAVEWRLTKTGRFSPTVCFDTIWVVDANISSATGHTAKYIVSSGIGPGAEIQVSKRGSIIPYIHAVTSPSPTGPQMPTLTWAWDVDADYGGSSITDVPDGGMHIVPIGESKEATRELEIERLYQFFSAIEAKHVGPAFVTKMYDLGFNTVGKFINATVDDFKRAESVEELLAQRAHDSIHSKIHGVSFAKVAGASQALGNGIGEKKVQRIVDAVGNLPILSAPPDPHGKLSNPHGKLSNCQSPDEHKGGPKVSPLRQRLLHHKLSDKKFTSFLIENCGLNKMAKQVVDNWPALVDFFTKHPLIVLDDEVDLTTPAFTSTSSFSGGGGCKPAAAAKSVQVSIASLLNKSSALMIVPQGKNGKFGKPVLASSIVSSIAGGGPIKGARGKLKAIAKTLSPDDKKKLLTKLGISGADGDASAPLSGKVVVFTGFRDSTFEGEIRKLGGKVTGSVSGKTSLLIEGSGGGGASKSNKARELDVPIITLEDFKQLFGLA
jgi:NAD-dependent DNA ligase